MIATDLPVIAIDLPVMFEDEGQEEMGESLPHSTTENILTFGLKAHFKRRDEPASVLPNLNLLYHPIKRRAYVSPDVMVVPVANLPKNLKSYRVGKSRPAPILVVEVLSKRTAQQGDLTLKPDIYSDLGVKEYWLVDVTGEFLEQRLILKTLTKNGVWKDTPDAGQGVVSKYDFKIIIDRDDEISLFDSTTERRYPRPDEADDLVDEIERLKAENARLKGLPLSTNGH